MAFSPLIIQLIEALRCLPGVGSKTAQRMAFHLLERDRRRGALLADSINQAVSKVGHCESCRTFTENKFCDICNNPKRDKSSICVVETPSDIAAIEHTDSYYGNYFVLMGHLSPLDGIGPTQLGLQLLLDKLSKSNVRELILATNHTVEGEATAHYIAQMVKSLKIKITRLAHGVPMGGELEFIDSTTITNALKGRILFDDD